MQITLYTFVLNLIQIFSTVKSSMSSYYFKKIPNLINFQSSLRKSYFTRSAKSKFCHLELLNTEKSGDELEKSFFDTKKISLKQRNLCIAIRSKKSFFDLKKSLDCFFFVEFKKLTFC